MKLEVVVSLKMRSVFNMRCLEHRQCAEGVFCPHTLLRVFSKRKRHRMGNTDLIFDKIYSEKNFFKKHP